MAVGSDVGTVWLVLYKIDDGTWLSWPKHGLSAKEADHIMNVEMPMKGFDPLSERKIVQVNFFLKDA